jgi:hypothetical protein
MMRDSRILRSLPSYLAFCAAFFLISSTCVAQTKLSVDLGFEGRLTPGHYAPILVKIHDYQAAGVGRLRITQLAGNEWRGEATLQQELHHIIQSSGRYEAVIPIYDPVNPIIIELLSTTGDVMATTTVDPRETMRPAPYPVLDKQLPRFDDRAAVVEPSSLPTQWWGFDSAESLWVASPLPGETWTAISQWVLAGGSLVVLTGTNFYRMDSPTLRQLLPISNPDVTTTVEGTPYLSGTHANATIDMISDEGFPLLLHGRYGAGQVAVVSVDAQSVSVEDLRMIATHITPAQLLTLEDPTELILEAQTVSALDPLFVLLMIVVLGALVCICAVVGRRNPRAGWSILFGCAVLLTVSSGFVSFPMTRTIDVYIATTRLYVQTSVASLSVFSSLFSQNSDPFVQVHGEEILPLQDLPRTLKGANSFDFYTLSEKTKQRLLVGEMRRWHAYSTAPSLFDFELLSHEAVRINNYHTADFDTALILIDGIVHPIANVRRGNHEYALDPTTANRLGSFLSTATGYTQSGSPTVQLVRAIKDALPLSTDTWLIAVDTEVQLPTTETPQKVRVITVVIAQEEEGYREI